MSNIIEHTFKQRNGQQVEIFTSRAPVVSCISTDPHCGTLVSVYMHKNKVVMWDRKGTYIISNIAKGTVKYEVNKWIKTYSGARAFAQSIIHKYTDQEVI